MIYLDNASTTQMDERVFEAMLPFLKDNFANPGSIYSAGIFARDAINEARQNVADLLHCDRSQIIFTSGGSEGNSLVFNGLKHYLKISGKTHILSTKIEHDSVLNSIKNLVLFEGFTADLASPDKNCIIQKEEIENGINNGTGLVSVMYMNNETGVKNPVVDISNVCRHHDVLFHTDCVQAAGVVDLNMTQIGCDFATISSHKINGPKGVGAIFAKRKQVLSPIIFGGAYQEFGYRGGTENVAGIVGFGEACKLTAERLSEARVRVSSLRRAFKEGLATELPSAIFNCFDYGEKIISVTIPNVDAQTLILAIGDKVQISAGSACNSRSSTPSHVLTAIGVSGDDARNTIRVSVSSNNTIGDITTAYHCIAEQAKNLMGIA